MSLNTWCTSVKMSTSSRQKYCWGDILKPLWNRAAQDPFHNCGAQSSQGSCKSLAKRLAQELFRLSERRLEVYRTQISTSFKQIRPFFLRVRFYSEISSLTWDEVNSSLLSASHWRCAHGCSGVVLSGYHCSPNSTSVAFKPFEQLTEVCLPMLLLPDARIKGMSHHFYFTWENT